MDPVLAFENLDSGWKAAFDQLWLAFRSGGYPVGAALVDGSGRVTAVGHNRINAEPGNGLSGTLLGHAEIDVLQTLSVDQRHDHVTLYSTLEPCLYCMGGVILSRVGTVKFAGRDPYGGASQVPTDLNAQTARYDLHIEGPLAGPFGAFGSALPLAYLALTDTWTRVFDFVRKSDPSLMLIATALADLPAVIAPGPVDLPEALVEAWPVVSSGY